MQNVDHIYRPNRMSAKAANYQPSIAQDQSQNYRRQDFRFPQPQGNAFCSVIPQKPVSTPQTGGSLHCPVASYQVSLPTPPPSPFGFTAPVANHNGDYFQYPIEQFHHLPTPPPSPPPYDLEQAPIFDIHSRMQFVQNLGSGAYGVVHLAKDVVTQAQYAVKVLNKYNQNGLPLDSRQRRFQQTEMQLHYEVSAHPNIVSLLRILDAVDRTYVFMEYCPEGDLFYNITERGRYVGNDHTAKAAFLQILDAVAHCHRLGVYHRDLKPENILVSEDGSQVKLADFGLATRDAYSSEFGCGSTFYMSPECQDSSSGMGYYACAPNDIWSLGVILVNLTCGRNPWKSASAKDSTFRAYVEDRHFLKSILPLSEELNDILSRIFELDPTKRITLDELRHRIIMCPPFTKTSCSPPPVPTAEVDEDFEIYSTALSPASTISEEGSMISDHSDDSTVPSEVDSNSDFDDFEVMDEDQSTCYEDTLPEATPAKDWDGPTCGSIDNLYVSDSAVLVTPDSDLVSTADSEVLFPVHSGVGRPPVLAHVQVLQRIFSTRVMRSGHQKGSLASFLPSSPFIHTRC